MTGLTDEEIGELAPCEQFQESEGVGNVAIHIVDHVGVSATLALCGTAFTLAFEVSSEPRSGYHRQCTACLRLDPWSAYVHGYPQPERTKQTEDR
jgi:hypothetical protein